MRQKTFNPWPINHPSREKIRRLFSSKAINMEDYPRWVLHYEYLPELNDLLLIQKEIRTYNQEPA